jgi:hypothetical protein
VAEFDLFFELGHWTDDRISARQGAQLPYEESFEELA